MADTNPSTPSVTIFDVHFYIHPMYVRFPFEYGIATMTQLPHLFAVANVGIGGETFTGLTAEHLPPKWFTKNPETRYEEDDLPAMRRVIKNAARIARRMEPAESFFRFWRQLYSEQQGWAESSEYPPLQAHLGTSIMERAALDAFCRGTDMSLPEAVRANSLGISLGELHPQLNDRSAGELLSSRTLNSISVRHTVGLGDPLTASDVTPDEVVDDGLPHTLEENIQTYGLEYFKIKVSGNLDRDKERLRRLAEILRTRTGGDFRFTLDGNEQFYDIDRFQSHWEAYIEDPALQDFFEHLLFVEQPLHRQHALGADIREAIDAWPDCPPMIIDESDGEIGSMKRALELGYAGTSHKNCKGVVKGIANACLLEHYRRQEDGHRRFVLSGEDLTTVGPISLLQDLTVMSLMGIEHVERNGHHYFKGLSMFPADMQRAILRHHGDLFRRHADDFATLDISDGKLRIQSLIDAPFGVKPLFDPSIFTPWEEYTYVEENI